MKGERGGGQLGRVFGDGVTTGTQAAAIAIPCSKSMATQRESHSLSKEAGRMINDTPPYQSHTESKLEMECIIATGVLSGSV